MIKGIIDSYELWQSRPENLNEDMEDPIKSAENRGWNQCNRSWIKTIDEMPRVDVPDTNVGEWIPCSERLPDKNGSYLVSFREAITNSYGLCVKYWSGEEQRWRPCNYAPSVIWKAWQPLPEPYKEGE